MTDAIPKIVKKAEQIESANPQGIHGMQIRSPQADFILTSAMAVKNTPP